LDLAAGYKHEIIDRLEKYDPDKPVFDIQKYREIAAQAKPKTHSPNKNVKKQIIANIKNKLKA
jgi:hypothetical protein